MHPGSLKTFYRARRVLRVALCIAPVVLLAATWWIVDRTVLTPATPGSDGSAAECVRFIADSKGLPRLEPAQRDRFLEQQTRRIVSDAGFREEFITVLRRSPSAEQGAFRAHLFDAFKPAVMADVDRFHKLADRERRDYLDDCIVEYNRMSALLRTARVDKTAFGAALPDPAELLKLLMLKTTEAERRRGTAYFTAMGDRIKAILADPLLEKQIRARIDAP